MFKKQLYIFLTLIILTQVSFSQTAYQAFPMGFYNLENLFDVYDDESINDEEFLPEGRNAWTLDKYERKQENMASVISKLGTGMSPDGLVLLGVSEIENRSVLEDLVMQDALRDRNYQIVHYDSPDKRGIDVGLIYNPSYFELIESKAHELLIQSSGRRKFTRDVLHVKGRINGEVVHVLVNHWPSRSGGEKRSAPGRIAAAELNKSITAEIYTMEPDAKIVIMGDLNDDPTSKSVKKILNAKKKIKQVKPRGFYNPMYSKFSKGVGSNAYRDSWSLFDQIIVSEACLDKTQSGLFFHKAEVFKEPKMLQPSGRYKNYPFRTFSNGVFINGYSDHFPVVAYFLIRA